MTYLIKYGLIISAYLWLLLPINAMATSVIAGFNKNNIDIQLTFSGDNILLFGSIENDGDIIIVLEGPASNVTVWKKSRKFGIWVNDDHQKFYNVPSYYYIATSRQEGAINLSGPRRNNLNIGYQHLSFINDDLIKSYPYQQAMLQYFDNLDIYHEQFNTIKTIAGKVFYLKLPFSIRAPIGSYLAHTYYVEDGRIVSAQTIPILVNKQGISAIVYNFAHNYSAIYGIICIILAILLGYGADYIFRRR